MEKLYCSHREFLRTGDDLKDKPAKYWIVEDCDDILVLQEHRGLRRYYEVKKFVKIEEVKPTVEEIKRPDFEETKPSDIFF